MVNHISKQNVTWLVFTVFTTIVSISPEDDIDHWCQITPLYLTEVKRSCHLVSWTFCVFYLSLRPRDLPRSWENIPSAFVKARLTLYTKQTIIHHCAGMDPSIMCNHKGNCGELGPKLCGICPRIWEDSHLDVWTFGSFAAVRCFSFRQMQCCL